MTQHTAGLANRSIGQVSLVLAEFLFLKFLLSSANTDGGPSLPSSYIPGVCKHKTFRHDLHLSLTIAGVSNRASTGTFLLIGRQPRSSLSLNSVESHEWPLRWRRVATLLHHSGCHGISITYTKVWKSNLNTNFYFLPVTQSNNISLPRMLV